MKKILFAAILALGVEAAQAQPVGLDDAIRDAAEALSLGVDRDARIAVVSMGADYVVMSNYLINGTVLAFSGMGFIVADQTELALLAQELHLQTYMWISNVMARSIGMYMGVQAVIAGTFEPAGDLYRFSARLIDVETGDILAAHLAHVQNSPLVAILLGSAGRRPWLEQAADVAADVIAADTRVTCATLYAEDADGRRHRGCSICAQYRASWFSIELGALGGGLRYQRDMSDAFSIGANAFFNIDLFSAGAFSDNMSAGILLTPRFFLRGFIPRFNVPVYIELGIGYGMMWWASEERRSFPREGWIDDMPGGTWGVIGWQYSYEQENKFTHGFMIAPTVGIVLGGRRRGHFANPFVSFPMTFNYGMMTRIRMGVGLGLAGGPPRNEIVDTLHMADAIPASRFSIEASLLGGGLRYERDINDIFSVGANVFFNIDIFNSAESFDNMSAGILATTRFFPRGVFPRLNVPVYIELGLGYGLMWWSQARERLSWDWYLGAPAYRTHYESYTGHGLMIAPAIGAVLGGHRGGHFTNPFISFPMTFSDGFRARVRAGVGLGLAGGPIEHDANVVPSIAAAPVNWLSIEGAVLGAGIRYERDVSRLFSIGANAFLHANVTDFDNQIIGALASARFFPASLFPQGIPPFFIELGLGYGGIARRDAQNEAYWGHGFMLAPAIGVRFGGQTTAFFANPFISLPVVLYDGAHARFRFGIGLGLAR